MRSHGCHIHVFMRPVWAHTVCHNFSYMRASYMVPFQEHSEAFCVQVVQCEHALTSSRTHLRFHKYTNKHSSICAGTAISFSLTSYSCMHTGMHKCIHTHPSTHSCTGVIYSHACIYTPAEVYTSSIHEHLSYPLHCPAGIIFTHLCCHTTLCINKFF